MLFSLPDGICEASFPFLQVLSAESIIGLFIASYRIVQMVHMGIILTFLGKHLGKSVGSSVYTMGI